MRDDHRPGLIINKTNTMEHPIDQLPIWQIVVWIITGLLAIVTFFSQITIRALLTKLQRHDDDIFNTRKDLTDQKMEIQELKSLVAMNTKADEFRMESLKKSFDSISEGISDIKQSQRTQQTEVKSIDQRLTQFIIDSLKGRGK